MSRTSTFSRTALEFMARHVARCIVDAPMSAVAWAKECVEAVCSTPRAWVPTLLVGSASIVAVGLGTPLGGPAFDALITPALAINSAAQNLLGSSPVARVASEVAAVAGGYPFVLGVGSLVVLAGGAVTRGVNRLCGRENRAVTVD